MAPLRSLRFLDEVQNLRQLDAFTPAPFLEALAAEIVPPTGEALDDVGRQLDVVRDVLEQIDGFVHKAMGIRLTHALAAAPAAPQLRTLLKTTVTSYHSDLPLLRRRVAAALSRLDPATAAEVTEAVMFAAENVLEVGARLQDGVCGLAREIVALRLPAIQRAARDRAIPDEDRQRWRRARVDLERIAADARTLMAAPFAQRLAQIEAPPDEETETEQDPAVTRFSLLEID